MAAIDDLVQVGRELVAIREGEPGLLDRKVDAIRRFAVEHPELPKKQVGAAIRVELREAGFSPEQISAVGVADSTVLRALERRPGVAEVPRDNPVAG